MTTIRTADEAWERIRALSEEINELQRKLDRLARERGELELFRNRLTHPCLCVRLNKDIGVYDMMTQERARRIPIGMGLVVDTLSASRDCPACGGSGIPRDQESVK